MSPKLEENPGEVARFVAFLLGVPWRDHAWGLEYVLSMLRGRQGCGRVELGLLVAWALEGWLTLLGVAREMELEVLEAFFVQWVACGL